MEPHLHWLAWAFTVTNTLRAVFYLPQLAAVARSTAGARDIALSTWAMWAVNNLLGTLYAGLVAGQWAMAASFAASLACCLTMLLLVSRKRRAVRPRWAAS